jgi:3-dehydroquinate synthase
VVVGNGISDRLSGLVSECGARRVFAVFDAQVFALHGRHILSHIRRGNRRLLEFAVAPVEKSKSAKTLDALHSFFLRNGIARDDLVIAIGGGVTSDLAGFAAASVLRGVRWAAVPTSLLGMVDAAIGGKTGINHKLGKNLIGAFWQPAFVLCDTRYLSTLRPRELIAGMGEVVKYAGLAGGKMLSDLATLHPDQYFADPSLLTGLAVRSVRYKARIVELDEREAGDRAFLNLGHTFAHGIETATRTGRSLLHGEAVLIGLAAACELSQRRAKRSAGRLEDYSSIIEQYLRLIPYRRLDAARVWSHMAIDKKRAGGALRYVLLSEPGKPYLDDRVPAAEARAALRKAVNVYTKCRGSR